MKILHVIFSLQKAAGTSVFACEVCNQLAAFGHEVMIAVLDPAANDLYPLDSRVRVISISLAMVLERYSPFVYRVLSGSCGSYAKSCLIRCRRS